MEIKIFDTLIHSGISVQWPSKPNLNINILNILKLIENEPILKGGLVQTSPWFDSSNSLELFYKAIHSHEGDKKILPVATIPLLNFEQVKNFILNQMTKNVSLNL